ncbi:hypothetical protein ACFWNN_02720 [Lentzea sp. NPDC058450]
MPRPRPRHPSCCTDALTEMGRKRDGVPADRAERAKTLGWNTGA